MTAADLVTLILHLAAMLTAGRLFGAMMRGLRQPAVVGEMLAGLVLSPTLLGRAAPAAYGWLFMSTAQVTTTRDAVIKYGMLSFLFIAGLHTRPWSVGSLGRRAFTIGFVGTLVPIAAGVAIVSLAPSRLWGPGIDPHFVSLALFVGMNLANSANPVIARILMDLDLLRTDIGTTIMAATFVDDCINWILFAVVLSGVVPVTLEGSLWVTVAAAQVVAFIGAVLLIGRSVVRPLLRALHRNAAAWAASIVTVAALLASSVVAEHLGMHAFLGAFLAGVALAEPGDEPLRTPLERLAVRGCAPLYFVSIGLGVDLIAGFDLRLVLIMLVAALASKIGGVLLGACIAGMPVGRTTLAIAWGLNARGATGVVLAGLGLSAGLIDQRLFIALVVMCITTSLMAGPAMRLLLAVPTPRLTLLNLTPERS